MWETGLSAFEPLIRPLSFPTWQSMFAEFHFFAGEDLLVQLDRDEPGPWQYVGIAGRTKSALDQARSLVKCDWVGCS